MAHAVGCDIVQIPRIEKLLEKNADQFLARVFTESEQQLAQKFLNNSKLYASHLAKRFAAKEAFAKAMGTGFGATLAMNDFGVRNNLQGAPEFVFSSKAQNALEKIFGTEVSVKLSLSDDYPQAMALVFIVG